MKLFKSFAYAALAGLSLAACSEDEPKNNGEQIIRGTFRRG